MPVFRSAPTLCRALAVVLTGLPLTVLAAAEGPPKAPETPRLVAAARLGWLRARIVSGRITFGATRLGSVNDSATDGGRKERLQIRIAGQEFAINYELATPDERLLIEIAGPDQLHVRRTPQGDSGQTAVDFRQPAEGPLRLSVGPGEGEEVEGEEAEVYEGPGLWHLLVTQPETCRKQLIPLLHILNGEWDLDQMAEAVEAELVRAAAEGDLPDPQHWAALVEQLGDDRFARRQAADRELRSLGRVVSTYLQQLDMSQLDAEQQYRVLRILRTLGDRMDNDTPPEVAGWLAGDPVIWLAMLSRDDEPTRRLAAERLEALLGGPIPFDPAADAEARQKQIDELRPRILEPR
jgi:hypothetical protein